MSLQEPLSRSGITTRAGIPNDVMTFWIRRGLVRPIEAPSGMGRHLRFAWYEANIAAVMMQLRQVGVPIDGLLSIANTFREAIDWANHTVDSVEELCALDALLTHRFFDDGSNADATFANSIVNGTFDINDIVATSRGKVIEKGLQSEEFRRNTDVFLTITEQPALNYHRRKYPDVTYFWRSGDRWRFGRGEAAPKAARDDGVLATVAVDISTVLYRVWNSAGSSDASS